VQSRLHLSASRHYCRQQRNEHTGAVGSFLLNSASGSYGLLRLGCCSAEASLLAIERSSSTLISYVDPSQVGCLTGFGKDTYSNPSFCGFPSGPHGTVPAG
jgi:hypothetical protein